MNVWEANYIDDHTYNQKIDRIYHENFDGIILFCHPEFEYFRIRYYDKIVRAANKQNLKIYAVVGCHSSFTFYPEELIKPKNVEVIYWPEVFFREAFEQFFHPYHLEKRGIKSSSQVLADLYQKNFDHHFIFLNNKGHNHRRLLIDTVCKHNLLEHSVYSWHKYYYNRPEDSYQFKYYDDRLSVIDERFTTEKDQGFFPLAYYKSFFQLVSETTDRAIFITEKTIAPLLLGKPFLIAGCAGSNKFIKDLGFELYDELFDYSFDNIENTELRYNQMCLGMKRIVSTPLQDLGKVQDTIKDKILYNRNHAIKLAYDDHFIPNFVKNNHIDPLLIKTSDRLNFLKTNFND